MAKETNPESPGQPHWKAAFTRRLAREGRWQEAQRRKVALTNGGMGKEEAWLEIYKEYPPLGSDAGGVICGPRSDPDQEGVEKRGDVEPTSSPEKASAVPHDPPKKPRRRRDFKRDVQWVYDNFERLKEKQVALAKAPSQGAWSLGQRAIENPQWFFKELCVKFFKEEEKGAEGRFDDERDQFRLLDIFEREERESRARKAEELELEPLGTET
jgi:hypothetical protein